MARWREPLEGESEPIRNAKGPLLKAFSWVVFANLSRQIAFLAVNLVLFDRLSRSTFGALALAFSYMTVFAGLGEFGIRQIAWRDIARWPSKARELAGLFLTTKALTAAVAMGVYLLMLPVLWNVEAPSTIYLLYGLGIAVSGGTFDYPLYALNRIDLVGKISTFVFGVYLVGCLVVVTEDSRAWLVPCFLAISMSFLLALELLWFRWTRGRLRLRARAADVMRVLRESWSLGLGETLNRLALSYPLILIGAVVGSEGVGNYRIAEMGYSFLAQFGHMFAAASFSHLSHRFQHDRAQMPRTLSRMTALTVAAALVAGMLFAVVGPPAFELVFGDIPGETVTVLQLLGLALVLAGPTRFLKALLPSIDKQNLALPANALGMAVGASVGWFATTRHGISGMALAVGVAELTTLLLLATVYWRSFRRVELEGG